MNPQTIARVFGVLYLITFITSIPAFFVFYAPVLDDARYILGAGADNSVALGAFLEIILIIANIGKSLVALHDWTFLLGPGFMVGVGNGLILGYLMYTSALVPRGMAVLGLIGGSLIIASGVGVMFGVIEAGGVVQGLATIPEALWELSLGIWPIVRGFNPSAIARLQHESQ